MSINRPPEELPVLFLYNINPEWDDADKKAAHDSNDKIRSALNDAGHPVTAVEVTDNNLDSLLSEYSPEKFILFNQCECLPGISHSEHSAVKIIESQGFTYTGSPPDVLLLAEKKTEAKHVLESSNIPTPAWKIYNTPEADDWNLFPAIVKTSFEHCSISLDSESVVMNNRELESRIEHVLQNYKQPAMVEDFIDGREYHIPLCGNGTVKMLPVVEMDFSAFNDVQDRLCTYDSKFDPESRHYNKIESRIPASLSKSAIDELEKICLRAYRAIGCRDYARLDVRERDGIFYVLDVNPNADLDIDASIACSAECYGMSYPEMLNYFIRLAANRHPIYSLPSAT